MCPVQLGGVMLGMAIFGVASTEVVPPLPPCASSVTVTLLIGVRVVTPDVEITVMVPEYSFVPSVRPPFVIVMEPV